MKTHGSFHKGRFKSRDPLKYFKFYTNHKMRTYIWIDCLDLFDIKHKLNYYFL